MSWLASEVVSGSSNHDNVVGRVSQEECHPNETETQEDNDVVNGVREVSLAFPTDMLLEWNVSYSSCGWVCSNFTKAIDTDDACKPEE
jgi:hypothetical protein